MNERCEFVTPENTVADANPEVSLVEEKTSEPIPIQDELVRESHVSQVDEFIKKTIELIYFDEDKLENEMKKLMSTFEDNESKLVAEDSTEKECIFQNFQEDEITESADNTEGIKIPVNTSVDSVENVISDMKINTGGPKFDVPVCFEDEQMKEHIYKQSSIESKIGDENSIEKENICESYLQDEIKGMTDNNVEDETVDLIEKVINDLKINEATFSEIEEPVYLESHLESKGALFQQSTTDKCDSKKETIFPTDYKQTLVETNEIADTQEQVHQIINSDKLKVSDLEDIKSKDNEHLMDPINQLNEATNVAASSISNASNDCEPLREEIKSGFAII
jgi:hypothetical protein